MTRFLFVLAFLCSFNIHAQTKAAYLQTHRYDLNDVSFTFPEDNFHIIGFGAYHGSAKTEDVEHQLLKALTHNGTIQYYLPETDYSTAYYYNRYLHNGDEELLKDLVMHSGITVQQERSIESFEKWKRFKNMNDALPQEKKLKVVGVDIVLSYKYTMLHLTELLNDKSQELPVVRELCNALENPATDFTSYKDSTGKTAVRDFVAAVDADPKVFDQMVSDSSTFHHILKNIRVTLEDFSQKREPTIFNNYRDLMDRYAFESNAQFMRIGFAHLEKEREGGGASFFTMLIEEEVYRREEVISVIGYLTQSEVLWDHLYDDNGDYESFTTEAGYGIGDYEKEYFRGIDLLKAAKLSDKTLFKLNGNNTPYKDGNPDLIEVIMSDEESNGEAVKGKSTTDFLDYAVLISGSKANTPVEELKL